MPDIMTRWLRGYRGHRLSIKRVTHRLLQEDIVPSPLQETFTWPDVSELRRAQQKHMKERPQGCKTDAHGLVFVENRLWVPDAAEELQWRLLITAH